MAIDELQQLKTDAINALDRLIDRAVDVGQDGLSFVVGTAAEITRKGADLAEKASGKL